MLEWWKRRPVWFFKLMTFLIVVGLELIVIYDIVTDIQATLVISAVVAEGGQICRYDDNREFYALMVGEYQE